MLLLISFITLTFSSTLTRAHIPWDGIYDGLCHEQEPPPAELDMKWVTSAMRGGWYVPLSSATHLHAWCNLFTGESCHSKSHMSKMCFKIRSDFTSNPFDLVHTGFGSEVVLNCTYTGKVHVCYVEAEDKYGNTIKHNAKVYVTYSDNKKNAIAIKCQSSYGSGRRAWALMSTEPTVDRQTERLVLQHVKKYGYDTEKTIRMDYSKCNMKW